MIDSSELQQRLVAAFPDAEVQVHSQDNVHFEALILSESFDGLRLVQRQQRVYAALGDLIPSGVVHALALQTHTPSEWQEKQSRG